MPTTVKQSGIFYSFDGMCWPHAGAEIGDIEWQLRYGNPNKHTQILAASIVSAYRALIDLPQKERNRICSVLKMKREE